MSIELKLPHYAEQEVRYIQRHPTKYAKTPVILMFKKTVIRVGEKNANIMSRTQCFYLLQEMYLAQCLTQTLIQSCS